METLARAQLRGRAPGSGGTTGGSRFGSDARARALESSAVCSGVVKGCESPTQTVPAAGSVRVRT